MGYYSDDKPKPDIIETDYRGSTIAPGKTVAYNRSGDVVLGTIETVVKNDWKRKYSYWEREFELLVKDEDDQYSKIKNPLSFVVIE